MTLEDLGYDSALEHYRQTQNLGSLGVGRVISEHKERYVIKTDQREYEGEVIGNLRFAAQSRADFPAVGDWVAISIYDDNKVLIHAVFPRKSMLARQSVGRHGEQQIIATNIDYVLIVQAVDRDFNINRIERYLTICHTASVQPIIVLNKIDLISETELNRLIAAVQSRVRDVSIIPISNASPKGIERLEALIEKGRTYCLLGSSGVGKSTLINNLAGRELMKTNAISTSTHKGRHVTTRRELWLLENGGLMIDNPGMREVGIADTSEGLERTFDAIMELARSCRFNDCTHRSEAGCAVIKAVEDGAINQAAYENFIKLEREKAHYEATIAEKGKKDRDFGKMVKQFKKKPLE